MRVLLFLLPSLLMAQAPAPKATATPAKAPTTAKAPATAAKSAKAAPAGAATAKASAPAGTLTEEQKTIYAIGLSMSQSLSSLDLSPAEIEILKRAFSDAAAGKPAVKLEDYTPKFQAFSQSRSARASAKQKLVAKAFLDKAALEQGATKTPSGLVYRELVPGTGPSPKATDKVKVNYRGTLTNGTEFDSSYKRNQPAEFPLNGVIPCWTEGVQRMKVGGKSQLVCPADIAYGDRGSPPLITGGATLVFEIELLGVTP
jgi:FKBP-type peptidyl-prolyl cis-trans isomerase FkpA